LKNLKRLLVSNNKISKDLMKQIKAIYNLSSMPVAE
jgi:hypothetical protein